jgi:uncharacterized integral membrane protein
MADEHSASRKPTRTRTERIRLALAFVLGALVTLFAVLNLDEVDVNWIVGTRATPLIVVIVLTLLIGAALGYVIAWRRTR